MHRTKPSLFPLDYLKDFIEENFDRSESFPLGLLTQDRLLEGDIAEAVGQGRDVRDHRGDVQVESVGTNRRRRQERRRHSLRHVVVLLVRLFVVDIAFVVAVAITAVVVVLDLLQVSRDLKYNEKCKEQITLKVVI